MPVALALRSSVAAASFETWYGVRSLFTGGDFSETDLRARFLVGRQWDGYALITSTLFELAEASVVVATEVAVGVSPGRQVSESGAL